MKLTSLILALLFAVACGKDNESGKPSTKRYTENYTTVQEEEFRQDFIREGLELVRVYENDLKMNFGARTVGLMRNRLKHENVVVTAQIIMNDQNEIVRSFHRNGVLHLYIGQGNLDWIRAKRGNQFQYKRLVMHEVFELADINDKNFRFTDKILRRR
jgi:hypothetical protein